MIDISSSNFAVPFDDSSSKDIVHASKDQTISQKDGLDPPSTTSMRHHPDQPKDSSYVSSCSEDDSTEHALEEEHLGSDVSIVDSHDHNTTPHSSLHHPLKDDMQTAFITCTSKHNPMNKQSLQEICNISIASSSHPALQENDADVDVGPTADLENLEVEVDHIHIPLEEEDDLKERISQLEKQLSALSCALQGFLSVSGRNNRLQESDLDGYTIGSPDTPKNDISQLSSRVLLEEEESPEAKKHVVSVDNLTTPDLNYRSYTSDYEQELRNLCKTSRGTSLDNNNMKSSQENARNVESDFNDSNKSVSKSNSGGDLRKIVDNAQISAPVVLNTPSLLLPPLHPIKATEENDIALPRNLDITTSSQVEERCAPDGSMKKMNTIKTDKGVERLSIPLPTAMSPSSRIQLKRNVSMIMQATWDPSSGTASLTQKNAVSEFIKSLNIDSRQQDGSASEDVDESMEEFLRVPFRIESLLWFGLATCFDCFLHILTVTPLKFVWSCICLACSVLKPGKGFGACSFHRRHLFQLLRVFVIVAVYKYALCPISMGKLYHWIRVQAMLKLYVLMAMVEVFDRLMCSIGQDALDSLYWNCTRRPYHPRMIASTIVVLVYTVIHSLILLVHVATLNVAMNSADQALLALLISGNFAEIKSTVFKKYNKQNLFKITTSDICERFKLFMFLGLVLLLNCSQGGMNKEMVNDYLYMSGLIIFAEMLCDWVKHSFITKFNFIKSSAYYDYSLVLAGDITGIGHDSMNIEVTHAVVKRLGFPQIPLVCVMFRYFREAARYADTLTHDGDSNHVLYSFAVVLTQGAWYTLLGYFIFFFICLFILKFLLGYAIVTMARNIFLYGPLEAENEKNEKQRR